MRTAFRVLLIALVIAGGWADRHSTLSDSAQALPNASITISLPGIPVVGEGEDFATTVLGDPWDMSEQTDILPWQDLPNAAFSGGVLSYQLPSSVGGLPLLFPAGSQIDVGKIGAVYPINTDHYRWLSFRLKQPANSSLQIRWHFARTWEPFAVTQNISVATSDWQTYVIDLKTFPKGQGVGASDWVGTVLGLYIVSFAANGAQVSLDWARLTANNPTSNSLTINWSGLSPSGSGHTLGFYLDSDASGCDGTRIYTQASPSAAGSFDWKQSATNIAAPANVAPGAYYVCALVDGSLAGRSSTPLTVNQSPVMRFTRPSFTSGPDYATEAGNPWDMSDSADILGVYDGSASFQGGNLAVAVRADQHDPQVGLKLPDGNAIDPSRYFYLTYKLWSNYPYLYNVDNGQFTRVFWGEAGIDAQSQLIYVFPGWQTYSVDLRSIPLTGLVRTWPSANWQRFRLDPISNPGINVTFYIDDVKLTGDEKADAFEDVQWQMTDPDTTVTTMTLYYDADRSGLNGTLIATLVLTDGQHSISSSSPGIEPDALLAGTYELTPTLFLPVVTRNYHPLCSGACYTWDTSSVPAGAHYLYACLSDGYNQVCRYSETPVVVIHPGRGTP